MLLSQVFAAFVSQRPYCVMVRGALERMLSAERLDDLFQRMATRQYERDLLFSSLVEVIGRVVMRVDSSVLAAYRALRDELGVSDEALYQKLRGVELPVSQELVRDSFREASGVLQALHAEEPSWVRGLRVKILDGNYLSASQRRLAELRTIWDAPLPGRALVVWDQPTRLIRDVFLTENGHASERSLLDQVLATVVANDLWIADRNFCTCDFLLGLVERQARFVIRQHGQLQGTSVGPRRRCDDTADGQKVFEQMVRIQKQGRSCLVRRVTVELTQPTRDGDHELHVFTNVTPREASAARVAELYRQRWTIEVVFLELQTALACEIHTLGYPKAALFTFCVALVLENTISLLNGSLRAAHGAAVVREQLSTQLLSRELQKNYEGMMVQIPTAKWRVFSTMSPQQFAQTLLKLAQELDLTRYLKSQRGPKKKPPPKTGYKNGGHVATIDLLAKRKPKT